MKCVLHVMMVLFVASLWTVLGPHQVSAAQARVMRTATTKVATIDPCKVVPDPLAHAACELVKHHKDIKKVVVEPLKVANTVVDAAVMTAMQQLAIVGNNEVKSYLSKELVTINNSSVPQIIRPWYKHWYVQAFGASVAFAFCYFLNRLWVGGQESDPRVIISAPATFVGFLILSSITPFLVQQLVDFFDLTLSNQLIGRAQKEINSVLDMLNKATLASGNPQAAVGTPIIAGFVGIISGMAMEVLLFFRGMGLYIFTGVQLFAYAHWVSGNGDETLRRNTRRIIALVLFKVIALLVLLLGLDTLKRSAGSHQIDPIVGSVALLILTPYLAYEGYKAISGHDPQLMGKFRQVGRAAKTVAPI